MRITKRVFAGFDAVPEHMAQLSVIAKSLGISRGALIRLLIAKCVNRAAREAARTAKQG